MSDNRCPACGEQTVYEEELGSAVCTHCGTLVDPDQSVLASHLEHVDVSGRDYSHRASGSGVGAGTLKGRNGWALLGQDKEARDRRNKVCSVFILKVVQMLMEDCRRIVSLFVLVLATEYLITMHYSSTGFFA